MLRVLLIDDEQLARLRLSRLLAEVSEPAIEVVGEAANVEEADAVMTGRQVDLVLLDIDLPGCDGLQLAARWRSLPAAPAVVFVTAHAEHALRAFELEADDYLTKPVRRERLQAALKRVAARHAFAAAVEESPVLVVNDRGRVLRLPLAEVIWLKAGQKYVTLSTTTHRYVLDDALADLEQRLDDGFLRVHRNAIVAISAVRALERRELSDGEGEGWAVRVAPTGDWLAVSRRQLAAVRQALAGGAAPS